MRSSHMWVKPCESESKVLIAGDFTPVSASQQAKTLCWASTWWSTVSHMAGGTSCTLEMLTRSAFPLCGPIQEVQNCMCEWARSQAGTTAAIHRPRCRFWKSTRIEIRDVGGTFSVSFNGVVQCTTDYTGQVLPARTDRDVYVSDPWYVSPDVILSNLVYTSVTCAA